MEAFQQLEGWVATLGLPVDPLTAIVGAASIILLLLGILLFVLLRSGASKDTFLLLGLSNAGKTALFEQLRDGRVLETFVSQRENDQTFVLHSEKQNPRAKPVHVIDFPGHQRLRSQLTTFLPITRAIVFVLDAVEFKSELTSNAQFLFDLFIDKTVNRYKIPFLIVCNKSEIITAKPKEFVQKDLEKEIDLCAKNQSKMEDINGGGIKEVNLGTKGKAFTMDQLPFKVSFAECSVKNGDIKDIEKFIRSLVK